MTNITVFDDENGNHIGFEFSGHAGMDFRGKDPVCAAASMLAINTVNAIETFAIEKEYMRQKVSEKDAVIGLMLDKTNHDTQLLIDTLLLEAEYLAKEFPKYVRLKRKGGVTGDRI